MIIDAMTDFDIAPCLTKGPLAESGLEFTNAARNLGDHPFASVLRAWCIPSLFTRMEQLLERGDDPVDGTNSALCDLAGFLSLANSSGFKSIKTNGNLPVPGENAVEDADVKEVTGDHYGNLFRGFSSQSYWDEPAKLLEQRLTRNGIPLSEIQNKSVLDSGCGGGRYSAAWRLLGAAPVVGVDISSINIEDAARRAELGNLEDIFYKQGNVLDLLFDDDEFDIVFSNGVLHHTTDWEKGIAELMRVLKPGGWGWLYLIENPGGVFWDVIEILRVVMKDEDKSTSRAALQQINLSANRIFYMLDHVMVPINLRLSPSEIEGCLHSCGAVNVRRLQRGADIDRIEHIFQGEQYAEQRFGIGENRYVFSKPKQ
ncbi:MAG: class I SAM-dependent methyltransferase [Acidobacteria bacterium]|nr:class I SAM-dependent methyltransferase [Acidobacteriota bacterium]